MNRGAQAHVAEQQTDRMTTESSSSYYQFEDINNAIIRLFRNARQCDRKLGSVLDLGCGRARLGLEVERLGYTVAGIDNNPVACATARTRISEVVELDFMKLDAVAAALNGRQFDWIMAADVLMSTQLNLKPRCVSTGAFSNPMGGWSSRCQTWPCGITGSGSYSGVLTTETSGVMDLVPTCAFSPFSTARELIIEAGFTPLRRTWEPGIARAFMPAVKGLLGRKGGSSAILESPAYRFYLRYVLPVEHLVCGIAPGLLAFRVVILARLNDCAEEPPSHRNQS